MSKSQNINLENNGRLFPLWVLSNFKDYEIPEIIRAEGEDPCNEKFEKKITMYQDFLGQFLNYRSPFKDILVYHGVGSGKTVSAINIYNVLFNYTPKWNVFLLIKASLKNDPWLKDLRDWIGKTNSQERMNNIKFVHYDSPFADRDFLEVVKQADSSRENMFVFDEAHNFIRNVYSNISSKQGKRAQVIYDYIQQEKRENKKTRIVLLSATPVVNNPYEFALIFNLLRPGMFPTSEAMFNQMFISSKNFKSLNENKKNQFQRRIMGLVSYYIGATPDKFARQTTHYKNVLMEKHHQDVYEYFEKIEEEKEKIRRRMSRGKVGGDDMSTFASYTRQACNFVFPDINNKVNGEKRPRPGQFKLSEKEGVTLDEGKEKDKITNMKRSKEEVNMYMKARVEFINELINYFKNIHRRDKENKHTINNDVKSFFDNFNGSFTKFYEDVNVKKSDLFRAMYKSSPKMLHIIFNTLKSPGSSLIYSNYVDMEGLQILKIYLSFFGFIAFEDDKEYDDSRKDRKISKTGFRYIEFHGQIDKDLREKHKKIFNTKENKRGDIIKIILLSPAGAEGINLRNVRQVHIMEPYWNEVRIEQVIGRAIRHCHHSDLPMNERTVDVFRYKMVRESKKETSDEFMENVSRRKNNLLLSFIEAVKEVAVDCELFKSVNMMGSKYSCFKFNQDSYFEKNIGPAFNKRLDFDNKMDNGSNSQDSIKLKIKVRKINAVRKLDEKSISSVIEFWYHDEYNVVYDKNLNYPIGKLRKDKSNNLDKLDKDTYILDEEINIPVFKLF